MTLIRPVLFGNQHIFGLCNQLGVLVSCMKQALHQKIRTITIGGMNANLFFPRYIPINQIFTFNLDFDSILYLESGGNDTDISATSFDFDDSILKNIVFSTYVEEQASLLMEKFGHCDGVIHSKLEKDVFALRPAGQERESYEKEVTKMYQDTMEKIPDGRYALLTHDLHSFWSNYPNVIQPERRVNEREISAAIDMCFAIKVLQSNTKACWVLASGSTFDFAMGRIGGYLVNMPNPYYIVGPL
jgi:hypothetical protein